MDITTNTNALNTTSSPFTTKKLEATTFALTAMEIDDSIAMLDTFFDPEESFADLPDDGVDESLLCELEHFDDCADAFSSTTAFPEPASISTTATTTAAPVAAAPLHSSQTFHSCADLTATEERLAAMMRKSALSRAQIQQSAAANRATNNASSSMTAQSQQQQAMTAVHVPPIPAGATLKPQTVIAASGFLTGKRSTLTNALEQSRKQLQQYMTMVNQQSQMQM